MCRRSSSSRQQTGGETRARILPLIRDLLISSRPPSSLGFRPRCFFSPRRPPVLQPASRSVQKEEAGPRGGVFSLQEGRAIPQDHARGQNPQTGSSEDPSLHPSISAYLQHTHPLIHLFRPLLHSSPSSRECAQAGACVRDGGGCVEAAVGAAARSV